MKRIVPALALLSLLAACLAGGPAAAQDRIAYANLEVILAFMPEAKTVSENLEQYQGELTRQLETKQAYAQQKLVEAQEAAQSGMASEAKMAEYEADLMRLDREIRQAAADADRKLMGRRADLMEPIVEKLQATIQEIAKADGYTHVLNGVDGAGTSIVLWGLEERDITKRILEELGIEIPEQKESATAPAASEGE